MSTSASTLSFSLSALLGSFGENVPRERYQDPTIQQTGNGSFKGGGQVFDLAHQGLDYSKSNNKLMTPDIIATLELYRQDIINGTIKVPDKP